MKQLDGLTQNEMHHLGFLFDQMCIWPQRMAKTLSDREVHLREKHNEFSNAMHLIFEQMRITARWLAGKNQGGTGIARSCRDIFIYCRSLNDNSVQRVVAEHLETLCFNWHHSAPSKRCRCGADKMSQYSQLRRCR